MKITVEEKHYIGEGIKKHVVIPIPSGQVSTCTNSKTPGLLTLEMPQDLFLEMVQAAISQGLVDGKPGLFQRILGNKGIPADEKPADPEPVTVPPHPLDNPCQGCQDEGWGTDACRVAIRERTEPAGCPERARLKAAKDAFQGVQ